jgi:hypothetical protein
MRLCRDTMKPSSDSVVCGAIDAESPDMVAIPWTQCERLLEDAVAAVAEKLCTTMSESFEKSFMLFRLSGIRHAEVRRTRKYNLKQRVHAFMSLKDLLKLGVTRTTLRILTTPLMIWTRRTMRHTI